MPIGRLLLPKSRGFPIKTITNRKKWDSRGDMRARRNSVSVLKFEKTSAKTMDFRATIVRIPLPVPVGDAVGVKTTLLARAAILTCMWADRIVKIKKSKCQKSGGDYDILSFLLPHVIPHHYGAGCRGTRTGAARQDNHPDRCAAAGGWKSLALAQTTCASLCLLCVSLYNHNSIGAEVDVGT